MWPPDGTSCISHRFGQQLLLLELVTCLATNWCHLHYFQFWPPGGATCMAKLPRIALIDIISWYWSVKSAYSLVVPDGQQTSGTIDWTPGTPWSDKNASKTSVFCWPTYYTVYRGVLEMLLHLKNKQRQQTNKQTNTATSVNKSNKSVWVRQKI